MTQNDYSGSPHPGIVNPNSSSDDESTLLQNGRGLARNKRRTMETQGWNVFRDPRPMTDSGSMADHYCLELILKIIKVLVYLIVFVIVLGSSVIAKGTILLMTSQLRMNRTISYCNRLLESEESFVAILPDEQWIAWTWCIIFAFAVPEIVTLIRSIRICLFKSCEKPGFAYFMLVVIMESFHVIGLAMMFTSILPDLDVIQGAMLTNCVCFVPGLLMLISRNKKRDESKRFIFILVDIVALAAQATAFVVWPLLDSSNSSLWLIPAALILVSCGWWENYISVQSPLSLISRLGHVKEKMKLTKHFTYIFVSIWKMITFFFSSLVILYLKGFTITNLFTMFGSSFSDHNITVAEAQSTVGGGTILDLSDVLADGVTAIITTADFATPLYVLAIQVLSAFFAYIFGKFACKILIQGFSFALPINLTIPMSISLLIAASALRNEDPCVFHGTIPDYLFYESPFLSVLTISDFISEEYAWVWLLWLISQTWITLHIWTPKCERLASTKKLFVTPMYNALLIDQSLGLNRNRNDQPEIIIEDSVSLVKEKSDTDEDAIYEQPTNLTMPLSSVKKSDLVTKIYACATMWHETKDEMLDFLKSILRLDLDQCARKNAQKYLKIVDPDYYELETHIFFDDAFEMSDHDYNESQVNRFINRFYSLVNEAVSDVHHTEMRVRAPTKCSTPYGGRLIWTLPGNTEMIVHLKDKRKIRHRKRWSQVMYMYYLLGHRIMDKTISVDRKEVIAENTYLLTLDGDIDFQPTAVKLLVDLMKKNKGLGAACGRIHPLGSGPMVWCQMFEYAITHWLQKAAEHVIGCVICSPGCFSLLRAKALMDDSVMKKYTTSPDEARQYVQYDLGEDRWLCSLLLQKGYRIEYSAASDAYTHAPRTFKEFYYQRRRWIPSTMVNLMDLIVKYKTTVQNNHNITLAYVLYQALLVVGMILGPGTIFLILVGAFVAAFNISIWTSFYWNIIPVVTFVIVCFTCRSNIQLYVTAVISIFYGLAMMVVLLSILIEMSKYSWVAPSSLFLFIVTGLLVIAGFMHPQELICLPCGVIYYLTIPSIYMLLVIYSITNLNDISWGTREVKVKKTFMELDEEKKEAENAKLNTKQKLIDSFLRNNRGHKNDGPHPTEVSFALFNCAVNSQDDKPSEGERQLDAILESLGQVMKRLDVMAWPRDPQGPALDIRRSSIAGSRAMNSIEINPNLEDQPDSEIETTISSQTADSEISSLQINPYWFDDGKFKKLEIHYLSPREDEFWKDLIEEYLFPIDKDNTEKARIVSDLKNLRDVSAYAFLMLNALFVLTIFLLELNQDILHIKWPFGINTNISFDETAQEVHITNTYLELEPIGLVFVFFIIPILMIQFVAMLFHRFGTFTHILASTKLHCCKKEEDLSEELALLSEDAVEIVKDLQRLDNIEDYDDSNTVKPGRRETIRNLEMGRRKTQMVYSNLDDTFRSRFFSISEGSRLPRTTSTRRSHRAIKAFEARRNTVIAERKKSQLLDTQSGVNNTYEIEGNPPSVKPGPARNSQILGQKTFERLLPEIPNFEFKSEENSTNSVHEMTNRPLGRESEFPINRQLSIKESAEPKFSIVGRTFELKELHTSSSPFSDMNI